jgi:Inner membrane protein YgaP-like, transmembrane domain
MILNEGTADRISRLVLAAAALLFSWWIGFGSVGGILLLVFAGVMLVTAAVGICPTYWLLKISTRPSLHRTSTSRVEDRVEVAAHH